MTLCTYKYNYMFHDSLTLNHKRLIFLYFNVIFDFLINLLYLSNCGVVVITQFLSLIFIEL
jgi:hypothetical protein